MRFRFLACVLLACCVTVSVSARDRLHFSVIGARDGLPNSSVSAIVQDAKGFLWFGTQGGLVRYDGYSFFLYENLPFKRNVLSHNQVQTLCLDNDLLWIGTYGGLNCLDLFSNTFSAYTHNPSDPASIASDLVTAIEVDVRGQVWVGTSKGLDLFNPAGNTFIHYSGPERAGGLPAVLIRDIHEDRKGRLWIATHGEGLFVKESGSSVFSQVHMDSRIGPHVMSISEDPSGTLWFASWYTGLSFIHSEYPYEFTPVAIPDERVYFVNAEQGQYVYAGIWGGGLCVYDRNTRGVTQLRASDGAGSIPNDVVYSSFFDNANVLWLGTNGGGVARSERTDSPYEMFIHDKNDPASLSAGKATAILEDPDGSVWIGIYAGGLDRLDPVSGAIWHYRADKNDPHSLPDDIVNALYLDSRGDLWISTNNGLARYDRSQDAFEVFRHDPENPDSIADNVIYTVCESPDGNLWVGTFRNGLDLFIRDTGVFRHFPSDPGNHGLPQDELVYALEYDNYGILWVGYNNGLDRYVDGVFYRYRYNVDNPSGISSNTIRTIKEDSQGRLWFGTVGGGLMLYDRLNDRFVHYTKEQGMPHNSVRSILEDNDGQLWVGTARGIGVLTAGSESIIGYSVFNELNDRDFHTGAAKASDGSLYFGGVNILYRFNPADRVENRPPVRVVLSDVRINGESPDFSEGFVSPAFIDRLTLPYNKNNVSLSVASIDFRESSRNMYSFKLEGFDQDWSRPSPNHTVTYTNLSGGSYTLLVRATDNDGYWNNEALSLQIRVDSPPWMSIPAWFFYLSVLVGIGYLIAVSRGKHELQHKVVELIRLQAELTDANLRLDSLSMHDSLTGLSNRRRLDELLPRLVREAARERHYISFLMIDIDCFKNYNDHYGHLKGDEALKMVAKSLLVATERSTDLVVRYGGEEFAVVLPHTDPEGARRIAARILHGVQSLCIPHESSTVAQAVTVSAGIAALIPEPGMPSDHLIEMADAALYRAKKNGRNRYV